MLAFCFSEIINLLEIELKNNLKNIMKTFNIVAIVITLAVGFVWLSYTNSKDSERMDMYTDCTYMEDINGGLDLICDYKD